FDASGARAYGTFLGGSGLDSAQAVAVTPSGQAFVAGATQSGNFPTVSGARQTALSGGSQDAFVTAFDAAGATPTPPTHLAGATLPLSAYLGGSGTDVAYGVAVDGQGRATAAGSTMSSDFPTYQPFQAALTGTYDAFVARLTATGTLSYSSYHGGSSDDEARG